ncbi:MAG TPA: hypothetical protein VIA07_00885 [Desulfuromonadales bacterium]|jgi:hypothetical protein
MTLLLVEYEMRASPFLDELCRGRAHRLLSCRTIREAADICIQLGGRIDWIVINGMPVDESRDLVGILLAAGCQAPVVYLNAGESATIGKELPGQVVSRKRMTRLDIHRLLTQPGGAFGREEIIFEYHGPHRVKVQAPM